VSSILGPAICRLNNHMNRYRLCERNRLPWLNMILLPPLVTIDVSLGLISVNCPRNRVLRGRKQRTVMISVTDKTATYGGYRCYG